MMPVSLFRDRLQDDPIVMSEISGVQLNRLLVLATRIDPRPNPSLSLVHELVVPEFSRMERMGIFSFAAGDLAASSPAEPTHHGR